MPVFTRSPDNEPATAPGPAPDKVTDTAQATVPDTVPATAAEKASGGETADRLSDKAALLDTLGEGVVVVRDGVFVYVNAPMHRMLGVPQSAGDFIGQRFDDWLHEDDRDRVLGNHKIRLIDDEGPEEYRFRLRHADGDTIWVSCRAGQIEWEGKKAVAASLFDVTAQVREQSDRRRAEKIFRNVFRLTPEIMALTDAVTERLIDVNPPFINMFGFRRDDVIGKTMSELGLWADPMFAGRFREELKNTATMTDVPTTLKTRGNLIRNFRLFAQKIEEDAEPMLLIIGRDVTDDLIQAQELQRSRDMAELANRAKSEFLANMSHELRTPLNAILGFAEILKDELIGPVGNERYAEYAGDIHESGTHLLAIINDILDLSKVESGRLEAHLTWVNPLPAMQMCETLVQQRAYEAGLKLSHRLDPAIRLEADERLIKQICLNLLSNAIKFTEPGGQVELGLEGRVDGSAVLVVEDTGIGMTPEEIKIAKRPFGQVDSSLSRRHQGSGLGLPLVAAFAEKMNASMSIVSRKGVGTCVSVIFPPHKARRLDPDGTPAPDGQAV